MSDTPEIFARLEALEARVRELESTVQELKDERVIRELLARYDRIASGQVSIQSYFTVTATAKKRCWETRGLDKASKTAVEAGTYTNPDREFSQYLNAWPFKSTKTAV